MHAQLAQSIADSQRPAADGRMARPAAGRSDALASFSELLQPTDIAARLGVSYSRQVALTGAALTERGIEGSRSSDRTDREVARRRAEPDRDGASARLDGKWNTPAANTPANSVASEQEFVAADPATEAPADDPEIESARGSPDEPDAAPTDATGIPSVPLTIPTFPSGTRLASDGGLEPDASTAATRAAHDPVVPVPADVAEPLQHDTTADSAPRGQACRR